MLSQPPPGCVGMSCKAAYCSSPPGSNPVQMISPFLVLTSANTIFTVSTCAAVRQPSDSSPLQSSSAGSKWHFVGSPIRPSFTPSSASHFASIALCSVSTLASDSAPPGFFISFDGSFHAGRVQMNVRIRGRAGYHAVEIVRKLGHFHQRLPAAGGAAVPIRILRALAVIGLDQRLRLDHGLMDRAPAEIDDLLRMPEREHAVAAFVAGVGGGSGVAFAQRRGHLREADDAGPAAVAHHLELAVPVLDGQPQLHLDVGVRRRPQRRSHAAMGRQHLRNHGRSRSTPGARRRLIRPGCDNFHRRERRALERKSLQVIARRLGERERDSAAQQRRKNESRTLDDS